MDIYLNKIDGYEDAFAALRMSKRSWRPKWDEAMRAKCKKALNSKGELLVPDPNTERYVEYNQYFKDQMEILLKWGVQHITLLRFIDFSFTVDGMHRAGQDDWDAHACRFNNRIIRASTRLGGFTGEEVSEWYQDKIIPMDTAVKHMHDVQIPDKIEVGNYTFVRSFNGYVREDLKDDKDVIRGLYMESIPSMFIFKVNLTEWAHIYKMRNKDTHANPEVKIACEKIADLLNRANPYFTRELFEKIPN